MMPSAAYRNHLYDLLADADQLQAARVQLGRGGPDPAGRNQAINRATVVMCVSAWEAFVEELAREAVVALRPGGVSDPVWAALTAPARVVIKGLNAPSAGNVKKLFATTIGLPDICAGWVWRPVDSRWVTDRLHRVLEARHEIAHGVHPRPPVESRLAGDLPDFFRRLGRATDAAVRAHLVGTLGVVNPWPP